MVDSSEVTGSAALHCPRAHPSVPVADVMDRRRKGRGPLVLIPAPRGARVAACLHRIRHWLDRDAREAPIRPFRPHHAVAVLGPVLEPHDLATPPEVARLDLLPCRRRRALALWILDQSHGARPLVILRLVA